MALKNDFVDADAMAVVHAGHHNALATATNLGIAPTTVLRPSGGDDTAVVQSALTTAAASTTPVAIVCAGILSVSGTLSLNNATSPITITGPGGFKLQSSAAANSWTVRLLNSPNVTFRSVVIDQNGSNQTNNVYGIYYDTTSANLLSDGCSYLNIRSFAFMSDGGLPTVRTTNVNFVSNTVGCITGGSADDVVVIVAEGGTVANNVITNVGTGFGIYIYESNRVTTSNNTVTTTGHTGVGIGLGSTVGCPVVGNSVLGILNDACYQVWVEVDNGGARTQADGLFVGNHAGMVSGGTAPAAYVVTNASNVQISNGTAIGCSPVLSTQGTCGPILLSSVVAPTGSIWTNTATFTSSSPIIENVGTIASPTYAPLPSTVTTSYEPTYGPIGNGSPTVNLLYVQRIFIALPATLTGIIWSNNSATAGNILVGLYNASGTKVAGSASTTTGYGYTTANAAFTSTYSATSGIYFIGIMASSASEVWNSGYPMGLYSTAAQGSFALPATITAPTTCTATSSLLPMVATY